MRGRYLIETYAMEIPYDVQRIKRNKRKAETTEQDKNNTEINVSKSEPDTRSINQSDAFEEPLRKSGKKRHCDWMKHNSDMYCPNIKFLKSNRTHRKTLDRLRDYIMSEPSIVFDWSQECEAPLSR